MKPKTQAQREVAQYELEPLSDSQRRWGYYHSFKRYALNSGRHWWCSECGQVHSTEDYPSRKGYVTCPHCGERLNMIQSKDRTINSWDYYGILTTYNGWQVYRLILANKVAKKGEKAYCNHYEVQRRWLRPDGTQVIYESPLRGMGCYYSIHPYCLHKDMILKDSARLNIGCLPVYGSRNLLPEYRKYGVTGSFHNVSAVTVLTRIPKDSRLETLWKAGQYNLFDYFAYSFSHIEKYWRSIRICLRNNYIVKDADMWRDYIRNLRELGLDDRNAKYVCPDDLKAAHRDMLRRIDNKREKDELREAMEQNDEYVSRISPYANLCFNDKEISIFVLPNIGEIKKEGDVLHHCIFKNAYYEEEDSLLFAARVDGERTESIEYSISEQRVLQCRGDHNQDSKYHKRIMDLFTNNIPKIINCVRAS